MGKIASSLASPVPRNDRKGNMDLTQEIILQHGRFSPYRGKMEDFTLSAEMNNPLCGDSVRIDLKVVNNQIVDICFSGEGCLISQAAASLLAEEIKRGKDLNKARKFNQNTVLKLLGISLTPSRVRCAMLSLETLKKALA